MTLIGKSHGNASGERSASTAISTRLSDGNGLPATCAHHLALEVLVQAIHLPENGSRPAIADRLAIEAHDRQHLLRGRGNPDLIRRAHVGLRSEEHTSELQSPV